MTEDSMTSTGHGIDVTVSPYRVFLFARKAAQ